MDASPIQSSDQANQKLYLEVFNLLKESIQKGRSDPLWQRVGPHGLLHKGVIDQSRQNIDCVIYNWRSGWQNCQLDGVGVYIKYFTGMSENKDLKCCACFLGIVASIFKDTAKSSMYGQLLSNSFI